MSDDTASAFAAIQESLQRLEGQLSDVTKDVDELKRTTPQRTAQPFGDQDPGSVQSTSRTQSVTQSGNSDEVVPILSWAERMELEDEQQDEDSLEPVDGDGRDSREQPVKSDSRLNYL